MTEDDGAQKLGNSYRSDQRSHGEKKSQNSKRRKQSVAGQRSMK